MDFRQLLGKQILFFDGAMGTMLQAAGLSAGELPDLWSVTNREKVKDIHLDYLKAGCNIIKTNTFGCNALKMADSGYSVEEVAKAAVEAAKSAIADMGDDGEPRFIALDIGPTGKLLKPLGDLEFEKAYELFSQTVKAGAQAGADLVLIETMSDTYELKAAVLAAKAVCDLPICATVVLDKRGKLLTGASVSAVCALLEGLGVDALGFNCSLGPREMMEHVRELARISSLPIILNPNAGLPRQENGRTVFDVTPAEFALLMEEPAREMAHLLGGCCGTTPEHIKKLVEKCSNITPVPVTKKTKTVVSSFTHAVVLDEHPILIGERINPTGKARLKQALRENDYDFVLREGLGQAERGADVLDVNAGLPDINEAEVLKELVVRLQSVTDLPLQIDTADEKAMENALRAYNGKPLINSVNGKQESMNTILPLVKKYGGVVVALTLDESGIPETADGRVEIARKIINRAAEFGIDKKDIIVDPLTLTVSAGEQNGRITLEALRRIKQELGVKTSLGVSNVSFGLPRRDLLNASFFALALGAGLDAAIMNPYAEMMMDVYNASLTLLGKDEKSERFIAKYSGTQAENKPAATQQMTLTDAILNGLSGDAAALTAQELESKSPMDVIENMMIPALDKAGIGFEKGTLFLPQLLMCAEAARSAFEVIKSKMGSNAGESRGKVVVATVKGDIHDIGKNIAKSMLENYRFEVVDVGKDVPAEEIVKAAIENNVKLVGLSALMTTTVVNMEETIKALHEAVPDCAIMVGGAVLTKEHAEKIGADAFVGDAMASVRFAESIYCK
ncbi:MAG: homocysteine S-methyltransferase family protein [Clostridia bacterium]|nr:homocysteine S-methyltransferase family protein [Clostridia bacterium]